MHPNSKAGLAPKRHIQSAEWHTLGFWLDGIWVTLKHILFNFLAIRMRPSSYSDRLSYFFESPILYPLSNSPF